MATLLGGHGLRPGELAESLRQEFPELHVDCDAGDRGLELALQTRAGVRVALEVQYSTDVDEAFKCARRLLKDETVRDLVADVLITTMGGYTSPKIGNATYILRWLVLAQRVHVTFGDAPEVEPVAASPSLALLHSPARRLKLWADGTAVLHFYDSCEPTEPTGLDLPRLPLRAFQSLWLPVPQATGARHDQHVRAASDPTVSEAPALHLLTAYDDGAWLRHHRFAAEVLNADDGRADWAAADRLSTIATEATLQDRAVLALACHLSGAVSPTITLLDALHFVGSARDLALECLGSLTGVHPAPDRRWPSDCSPSCP